MSAQEQTKARVEAIVTELELVGLQGAYPLAERILEAIKQADEEHILKQWNELGKMGLAALREWMDSKS